jgi:hypothetical protein
LLAHGSFDRALNKHKECPMADDKLDTDKIVAALFTVEICAQQEPVEPRAFMPVYREFLELLKNEHPKPAPIMASLWIARITQAVMQSRKICAAACVNVPTLPRRPS